MIARHPRSYDRDDFVFDPVHYLSLLERKTGALDQAVPLAGWGLPEEFGVLRRLLESRMGRRGKREFVQVLRLMENFRSQEVHEAVRDAIRLGAISFDAVKHLVLCRMEGRPQRLDLELYPYLPRVSVTKTSARSTVLLEHHLKELKMPTFLREYGKVAGLCTAEGAPRLESSAKRYLYRVDRYASKACAFEYAEVRPDVICIARRRIRSGRSAGSCV